MNFASFCEISRFLTKYLPYFCVSALEIPFSQKTEIFKKIEIYESLELPQNPFLEKQFLKNFSSHSWAINLVYRDRETNFSQTGKHVDFENF